MLSVMLDKEISMAKIDNNYFDRIMALKYGDNWLDSVKLPYEVKMSEPTGRFSDRQKEIMKNKF